VQAFRPASEADRKVRTTYCLAWKGAWKCSIVVHHVLFYSGRPPPADKQERLKRRQA